MKVVVVKPARGTPLKLANIVLQQDAWDDFGFKTQYHIYYFSGEEEIFVGNVKILQRGQIETSSSVLTEGPLEALGENFCSLGQSLDYYERLAALPEDVRSFLLDFLRDALAHPVQAEAFQQEKGWRVSVTRDLDLNSYVPLARTLLERDYDALPSMGLDMTFNVTGWQESLRLDFAAPAQVHVRSWPLASDQVTTRLPERVAVLTGRNGSGKSTLMARLARVLHASQRDRRSEAISRLGTINPPGIGFSRVVTVAYSAFDTFQVPGVGVDERRQIAKDLRAGTGRYSFAGLRDIAAELEESLESEGEVVDARSGALDDRIALDRQSRTRLKSAEQLADEYARTVQAIFEANRSTLLLRVRTH